MYVCIYIEILQIDIYTYIYLYSHIHVYIHVCLYVHVYLYKCVCTYIHVPELTENLVTNRAELDSARSSLMPTARKQSAISAAESLPSPSLSTDANTWRHATPLLLQPETPPSLQHQARVSRVPRRNACHRLRRRCPLMPPPGLASYIHSYMHACKHTYIRTYIRTYIHTNIHTYIHTNM